MEYQNLLELIKTVSKSNLSSFHYEEGETKIIMSSGDLAEAREGLKIVSESRPVVKEESQEQEMEEGQIVTSPLVGTFYSAPSQDGEPFVSMGDVVKKGQTLAIVEAMKLMNDIECEFDGTISKIFVKNGDNVEYGQPLFSIA